MRIHRLLVLPFLIAACVPPATDDENASDESGSESGNDDEATCQPGTLGCECVDNLCFDGLECNQGTCESAGTDGSTDSTSEESASEDSASEESTSEDSTGEESTGEESTDEGACTELGCACDDTPGSCDAELACVAGACSVVECGDGVVQGLETCDDGNAIAQDGCELDCTATGLSSLYAGDSEACVIVEGGALRCWGRFIGDDEFPSETPLLVLDEPIVQVAIGTNHKLVLTEDGGVRCWGVTNFGQCGYGTTGTITDPLSVGDVAVGGTAVAVFAGNNNSCALLDDGNLRCWGNNHGYGIPKTYNGNYIGDDELPASVATLPLGSPVVDVSSRARASGACALLESGDLRCWGANNVGQFGYGHTMDFIVSPSPAHSPIPLGLPPATEIVDIESSQLHGCTLYSTGDIQCWGEWDRVGQGGITVGDDELPSAIPPLSLGGQASAVSVGPAHSCALLDDQEVICWGIAGPHLGVPGAETLDFPSTHGPVQLDTPALEVDVGWGFSCARLVTDEVVCWGANDQGQLGLGHTEAIGDDEDPSDPVVLF